MDKRKNGTSRWTALFSHEKIKIFFYVKWIMIKKFVNFHLSKFHIDKFDRTLQKHDFVRHCRFHRFGARNNYYWIFRSVVQNPFSSQKTRFSIRFFFQCIFTVLKLIGKKKKIFFKLNYVVFFAVQIYLPFSCCGAIVGQKFI